MTIQLPFNLPPLQPGELAALLDAAGPSDPQSTRHTLGSSEPLGTERRAELRHLGVLLNDGPRARLNLSPAGQILCDVIRCPRVQITTRIWVVPGPAAETHLQFPGPPAAGRGVALNRHQGRLGLAGPVTSELLLEILRQGLASFPPSEDGPPFEALLDVSSALALFAAIDATCGGDHTAPSFGFTVRDLHSYLLDRWGQGGLDELVSIGLATSLASDPPGLQPFGVDLCALASLGFLEGREGDRFDWSTEFQPVAQRLARPSAGLAWERVTIPESSPLTRSMQTFLALSDGVLRLAPGRPGFLFLQCGGSQMAVDFLAAELADGALPEASPPPPPIPSADRPPTLLHQPPPLP